MKKRIVLSILLVAATLNLGAAGMQETQPVQEEGPKIVASTSWTAAFADLGGLDDITAIAPPSLIHPPEYEITVSDVQTISDATYFIYAGYERMMKSMGDSIGGTGTEMIAINTDNSVENVTAQARKIADIMGTQQESEPRLAEYVATIESGKQKVQEAGMDKLKVYCHSMQVYQAKDLGLDIEGTFGPGPVTAQQIAEVAQGDYDIIIDNVHNPVASPLQEVSPTSKVVVWRNFPETVERGSLNAVVAANIEALLAAR